MRLAIERFGWKQCNSPANGSQLRLGAPCCRPRAARARPQSARPCQPSGWKLSKQTNMPPTGAPSDTLLSRWATSGIGGNPGRDRRRQLKGKTDDTVQAISAQQIGEPVPDRRFFWSNWQICLICLFTSVTLTRAHDIDCDCVDGKMIAALLGSLPICSHLFSLLNAN